MSTPLKPLGKTKAPGASKSEQAHSASVAAAVERESLASVQAAFGRERRLEKLARKDPVFRGVLADLRAKNHQLAAATARIAELEAKLAQPQAPAAS